MDVVNRTTQNSARYVQRFVRRYLAAQLDAARGRLREYASIFSTAMGEGLDVARQGEGTAINQSINQ